jgi:Zn-dependent protease with chaperone function
MYGNVIVALAVILMLELLPGSASGETLGAFSKVCLMAGAGGVYLLFVRTTFLWWKRNRGSTLDLETFPIFHSSFVQRFVIAGAILYGLLLYWLGWRGTLEQLSLGGSDVARGLLGIAPFVLILLGVWAACFPGGRFSRSSLGSYLWTQARLFLPVLVPWAAILAFMDLMGLLAPGFERRVQENALWGLGVFGVLLLMLAWGFPTLVIRLWKCSPMPPGQERSSLEHFFREHRFRYKELFLWNLLQGSTATAGIMGIFPGSRYILLTPSLLSLLQPEELEAVMAHEMGHVRHLHMVFYLAFMLGLTLLLDLCLRAAPWALVGTLLMTRTAWIPGEAWWKGGFLDSSTTGLAASLVFVGLAVVYLRFGFGLFSRNFERQADLYALEVQGSPLHLIRSLEKIGGFHPLVRSLPSWHHYSIQERVSFLIKCQHFPGQALRHHRKVRRLVGGYLLLLLVLLFLVVGWRSFHWDRHLGLRFQATFLDKMLEQEPGDPVLLFLAGSIAIERNDLVRAQKFLEKCLELRPGVPEALNNLAWLYATARDPRLKNPPRALSLALEAARLKPDEPHILDTLAEAYFLNGHIEEAIKVEQRALSLARHAPEHYLRQLDRFRKALPEGP